MKSFSSENTETPTATVVIRPSSGWMPINWRDLWSYREVLYFLTWREIKVRYKQTLLGFAWAVIQPVFMMIVFSLFFGTLAQVPSDGIPYPLFSYAALLPWTMFAQGLDRASNSLIANVNLVQKVYCPRLIMPISGAISPLVDFAIAFVVLIGLMAYYGYAPTINVLWLPALLLLALMTTLGVGLWLSAINVRYRDIRYTIPFLIQLWMYASPVVYSSTLLPEKYQILYGLNTMAGVINGFRWALLGTEPPGPLLAVSVTIVVVILVTGVYYFRHNEKIFADVV